MNDQTTATCDAVYSVLTRDLGPDSGLTITNVRPVGNRACKLNQAPFGRMEVFGGAAAQELCAQMGGTP